MRPLIVVLGVSGAGKSTVGALLAEELGVPFADADALHSEENVGRMSAGLPLDDELRLPWLRLVGRALADAADTGLVMASSALRRSYREVILAAAPATRFVLLDAPRELLERRLAAREGHFMPAVLLASQLATLEPLGAHEPGVTVSVSGSPAEVVAEVRDLLSV